MKSLVLTNDGLQLADTVTPSLLPGYVKIEVRSVGISRTDIKIWKGDLEAELPIILGTDITGTITESSDPMLAPGNLVTTDIIISCGTCYYCTHKQRHLCKSRMVLGMTIDGGLAEYITVPAENIHILPEGVDATTGTFVRPLATALTTFRNTPVENDEAVAVIGTGKNGLLISQVYDAFGAEVYLVGKNRWHLGAARKMGLRNTIDSSTTTWKDRILSNTNDIGPRVVIDATGNANGIRTAIDLVRNGGVVVLTDHYGDTIEVDPNECVGRDLRFVASNGYDFKKAIELLAKGRIEVREMLSAKYTLEEGMKAFESAIDAKTVKVNINI